MTDSSQSETRERQTIADKLLRRAEYNEKAFGVNAALAPELRRLAKEILEDAGRASAPEPAKRMMVSYPGLSSDEPHEESPDCRGQGCIPLETLKPANSGRDWRKIADEMNGECASAEPVTAEPEEWMRTELWNFAHALALDLNLPKSAEKRIHTSMVQVIIASQHSRGDKEK